MAAVPSNPAGLTWCPVCREETIPRRDGTCNWCDTETQPLKAPRP